MTTQRSALDQARLEVHAIGRVKVTVTLQLPLNSLSSDLLLTFLRVVYSYILALWRQCYFHSLRVCITLRADSRTLHRRITTRS